ncbi:hypothetical protein HJC23_012513 [Cyclotella cryptica]|uniref:Rhomboid-like protein n=1 Tax=Cyclotella cryptica TaxID=29204 RepID=A0ABD3QPX8_9STRA|eukprot:CCRYP_003120-RA/>CCRYP_003120-RA protein AED:0.05 eAED:0.05 QI:241/-1/1/1/-1/1/1/76/436
MTPPSRIYDTTTHSPMFKIIHAAFLLTWVTESPKYTAHAFHHPPRVTFSTYPAFRPSTNKAHSFQRRLNTHGNLQLERNDTAFRDVMESTTTFVTAINVDLDASVASSSRYNKSMRMPYSTTAGGEATAADNTPPVPTDVSSFITPSRNQPSPTSSSSSSSSWKDRLIDISNIASFLCVLDCTLLPLLSIALPIVSWISTATASIGVVEAWSSLLTTHLPSLAHVMALFFVIPVGLLTALVNYFFGHRQIKYTAVALFGLCLIYTTNSHVGLGMDSLFASPPPPPVHAAAHVHDACGAVVGAATGMLTHTCGGGIGEGWVHRLMNTVGCGFLLGSNYYGKKYMEKRSRGCAASVLVEAWGNVSEDDVDGGGERRLVCLPGCGCEVPSYGKGARLGSPEEVGGEMFFSWDGTGGETRGRAGSSGDSSGRKRFQRFRQ